MAGSQTKNQIKLFADNAKTDATLQEKLKTCERAKELVALSKEYGFTFAEEELYPPNEPQFTAEQLHPKLVKALLR
ncbi:Nif11-like leader peptide family natural product precursor [Leptolyngbya ohadii]|uniref:Nif11-like leader peptide family natural product precursor n=1 Tax=Leptolyngbya ohadii TaxID=1962290 RepID=UPI000B59EE83|nr:Nif11-like leader peptide family natural product precursor [Leptolyngbya ohadii]